FLETRGGLDRAEMTIGIDNYPYTAGHGCSRNASDKGELVHSIRADVDCIGLSGGTFSADIDCLLARWDSYNDGRAQGDVAAASCVVHERIKTDCRVVSAACEVEERI